MGGAGQPKGPTLIDNQTRRLLTRFARSSRSRTSEFRRDRPTDWRPTDVRNPQGLLNTHFTNPTAWDLIAARLENGEDVELVELNKPKGRLGYVMLIDLGPDVPQLYVKLQLGAGIVIGRSFHYTDHD